MGTKGSFAGGKAAGELSWQIASIWCRGKEWVEPHFHSSICLHCEVVNQAQGHLTLCPFTFKLKVTSIEFIVRGFACISIQWKYYIPTHYSRGHYEDSNILGYDVLWTDRVTYRCLGGAYAFIFSVVQSGWLEAETSSKTLVHWVYQSTLHHILAAWNHHQHRCDNSNVEWYSTPISGAVHKYQCTRTFRNDCFPNAIKRIFDERALYHKSRPVNLFLLQFCWE
jgi:hypothetical protein